MSVRLLRRLTWPLAANVLLGGALLRPPLDTARLATHFRVGLTSRPAAARYGLWVDEPRGVVGLVRARMADGSGAISLT